MRKLILEEWLSLDGYAVDKEGTLDFFPASEADQFSDRDQLELLEALTRSFWGDGPMSCSWTSGQRRRRTRRSSPTA
jgi:hypothetical protein